MSKHQRSGEREQRWRDLVARFAASGLSVRAFCRQERLPESAFYFWRRSLQERDAAAATGASAAFLPVSMPPEFAPPTAKISIELNSGVTLRFEESACAERIAALVRALQSSEAHA